MHHESINVDEVTKWDGHRCYKEREEYFKEYKDN
jgi:hypothetical protein